MKYMAAEAHSWPERKGGAIVDQEEERANKRHAHFFWQQGGRRVRTRCLMTEPAANLLLFNYGH